MTVQDYSFKHAVTLTVGTLDLSACFSSLSLGLQLHEPESPLVWSGSLTLSLTIAAQMAGVASADLDPLRSPARWATGLQLVTVATAGVSLRLRIKDWRYDSATGVGSGSVSQQIELYNKTYPELTPELVYTTPAQSTKLQDLITRLIAETSAACTVPIVTGILSADQSTYWGLRATRQPLNEVQGFAKCSWSWLTQSLATEQVDILPLQYTESPIVFARAAAQARVEPSYSNISFAAPRVIAHGSADVPDPCGDSDGSGNAGHGDPKREVTLQYEPLGKLFPSAGNDQTQVISQRKTILRFFLSDTVLISPEFYPMTYPPIPTNESSGLYRTEVIIEEPSGKIFPALGANTTLNVSARTVEVAQWKATWKPAGMVFPSLGSQFYEQLDSYEVLQTAYVRPGSSRAGCTDRAKPEVPRAVDLKLKQEVYTGTVELAQGYTPVLNYPYTYNIGYCPSSESAQLIASRLAFREVARKFADDVSLPLPLEWLQAGCPHFARCQVGDKVYWVDGPAFELTHDAQGRLSAKLQFTGLLVGTATAVVDPQFAPFLPDPGISLAQSTAQTWPTSLSTSAGTVTEIQL